MELQKFENYDAYKRTQVGVNRAKRTRVWVTEEDIARLAEVLDLAFTHEWLRHNICHGLCHGVRTGWEVEEFRRQLNKRNTNCNLWGTDIAGSENPSVYKMDFHKMKDSWVNAWDFIYSNSLDHSYDPPACLETWCTCLRPGGLMFVQWTPAHSKAVNADCFGAELSEYVSIMSSVRRLSYKFTLRISDSVCVLVSGRNRRKSDGQQTEGGECDC